VAGGLRLDLASFRELEAFAQLGTELDPVTQSKLDRGYRMVELLKQAQYKPMSVTDQVLSLYAATRGFIDDVPVPQVRQWESDFLQFIHDRKGELFSKLEQSGDLTSEIETAIREAIEEFKRGYRPA
jgi:F-type H+-transporting ATPase subunit alpha